MVKALELLEKSKMNLENQITQQSEILEEMKHNLSNQQKYLGELVQQHEEVDQAIQALKGAKNGSKSKKAK